MFKRIESKIDVQFVDYHAYSNVEELRNDVFNNGVMKIATVDAEHDIFDPQTNASTATLDQWSHSVGSVLEGDIPINDAIYQSPEGFDVLPADYHLTSTELKLLKTQDKESKLKQALATLGA